MPSLTASSSLTALSATPAPSGTGRGASGTQPARFTNGPCHGGAPPAPGERGHRTPSPDTLTGRHGAGTARSCVLIVSWTWYVPGGGTTRTSAATGTSGGPARRACRGCRATAARRSLTVSASRVITGSPARPRAAGRCGTSPARAAAIPGLLNKRRNPGSGAYQSRPGGFGAGPHGGPPDTFGGRGGLVPEAGGSMSAGDLWLLPALPAPGRLDREAVTMSEDLAS